MGQLGVAVSSERLGVQLLVQLFPELEDVEFLLDFFEAMGAKAIVEFRLQVVPFLFRQCHFRALTE